MKNGLLVKPKDPKDLEKKASSIFETPAINVRFRKRGSKVGGTNWRLGYLRSENPKVHD